MSETAQDVKNPYATDNMPEGGGLTREAIVTAAKYVAYPMTRKDGTPVINEKSKKQAIFSGLQIQALRVGGEEGKIDKYEFSAGEKAKPSPDGELLLNDKGEPAPLYKKSNLGRFIEGLRAGGFDPTTLYPRVSVLVGAKITFGGQDQKDAQGKVKTYVGTDGKPHNSIEWFPVAYNGGAGTRAASGNGAGSSAADLTAKAEAAVVAAIAEAGGSIARKDLIRALGTNLKGDADAVRITALVAKQDFHTGRPWTFDGSTLALEA